MQLVVSPVSVKNHYQFATHSTGSLMVHCLCFIPMQQYLLLLISHMSEDDEITLAALSMRASVRKGLYNVQVHPNMVFNWFKPLLTSYKSLLWVKNGLLNFHHQPV